MVKSLDEMDTPPPIGAQKVPLDHISSAAARFIFSTSAVRRSEPLTTKAERDTEREQQHEDPLSIISFGGSTWLG